MPLRIPLTTVRAVDGCYCSQLVCSRIVRREGGIVEHIPVPDPSGSLRSRQFAPGKLVKPMGVLPNLPSPGKQKRPMKGLFCLHGGEGGIRTPGPLPVNGFQDRRFRPLSHLSVKWLTSFCVAGANRGEAPLRQPGLCNVLRQALQLPDDTGGTRRIIQPPFPKDYRPG